MNQEPEKSAQALQTALQMEIDGREFYHKSGVKSTSPLARKLFQYLAEIEDIHYQTIKEIYEMITSKKEWPEKETVFEHEKSLRTVFKEAVKEMGKDTKGTSSEIEAITTAMKMEDQSYSFYRSRSEEPVSPTEKAFYQALTAEERGHYLTLVDSHDYLSDPQGWFAKSEHWGLDGA